MPLKKPGKAAELNSDSTLTFCFLAEYLSPRRRYNHRRYLVTGFRTPYKNPRLIRLLT